jgi:transposase
VKQEKLSWLAAHPFYTKRFAMYVGKRCQSSSISDVAKELHLNWKTVKELEKEYLREKLMRAEPVTPRVIGIDEISRCKGHTYSIVVSDLEAKRAIWFDGPDRSESSMNAFYAWLGADKCASLELAVMDMWKPFAKSLRTHAPQAALLFDKFHIMRHLGEALDAIRKREYARLSGKNKTFVKGQKYNLLSHWANLSLDGKHALKMLLAANKRLNTAYMLKESFSRLWDFNSPAWARKFFNNWKESLKWQRLKPFEEFAELIEKHWDGIVAYTKPENKNISLGFVEGLNNKIRVFQRRAYGLKDQEYLKLKVLTCMLPEID